VTSESLRHKVDLNGANFHCKQAMTLLPNIYQPDENIHLGAGRPGV